MLNTPALDWLRGIGAAPETVSDVVLSHLHGDHVGWNTHWVDNRWQPVFVNATYHMPRIDLDWFKRRHEQGEVDPRQDPFVDSVLPVVEAGLARFVEDGDTVAGCLRAHAAPGHTPGQMMLSLRPDAREFIFCADVLHSPLQVFHPDVNSRWCVLADVARATRRALLERAARTGVVLMPAHAKGVAGWTLASSGGGYVLRLGEEGQPIEDRALLPAAL
jgi:glyoxylase-like metal-dependent hydrolase (beta-lactamase superfamily II)